MYYLPSGGKRRFVQHHKSSQPKPYPHHIRQRCGMRHGADSGAARRWYLPQSEPPADTHSQRRKPLGGLPGYVQRMTFKNQDLVQKYLIAPSVIFNMQLWQSLIYYGLTTPSMIKLSKVISYDEYESSENHPPGNCCW